MGVLRRRLGKAEATIDALRLELARLTNDPAAARAAAAPESLMALDAADGATRRDVDQLDHEASFLPPGSFAASVFSLASMSMGVGVFIMPAARRNFCLRNT